MCLQVEVATEEPLSCPISLEVPPVVPVMTSCGHVFSLPSIVRCLQDAGSERLTRTAPCPLCFNPVSARDLRLVVERPRRPLNFEEPLSFSLLRRARREIMPRLADAPHFPFSDPADPLASQPFARFVCVPDGLPPFRRAAEALARATAAVTAEGSPEVDEEGFALFKAVDVLATTAYAWFFRKEEAPGELVGASGNERAAAARAEAMATAVRSEFTSELEKEQRRIDAEAHAAAIAEVFPALGDGVKDARGRVQGRVRGDAVGVAGGDGGEGIVAPEGEELLFPLEGSSEGTAATPGEPPAVGGGDADRSPVLSPVAAAAASAVVDVDAPPVATPAAAGPGGGADAHSLVPVATTASGGVDAASSAPEATPACGGAGATPACQGTEIAQKQVAEEKGGGGGTNRANTQQKPKNKGEGGRGDQHDAGASGTLEKKEAREKEARGDAGRTTQKKNEAGEMQTGQAEDANAASPQNAALKKAPLSILEDGDYWFYQSSDGSALFLHPLNVRICSVVYRNAL
jgi:hypothetical protein